MFGLGFFEVLTISLLGFLVFGPKKFAEIAKNFLKALNELKRAWGDVQSRFEEAKSQAEMEIQKISPENINLENINLEKINLTGGLKNLEKSFQLDKSPTKKPAPTPTPALAPAPSSPVSSPAASPTNKPSSSAPTHAHSSPVSSPVSSPAASPTNKPSSSVKSAAKPKPLKQKADPSP